MTARGSMTKGARKESESARERARERVNGNNQSESATWEEEGGGAGGGRGGIVIVGGGVCWSSRIRTRTSSSRAEQSSRVQQTERSGAAATYRTYRMY